MLLSVRDFLRDVTKATALEKMNLSFSYEFPSA